MKTYYCVKSTLDDDDRATAELCGQKDAEEMPESTAEICASYDVYYDWFESRAEAEAFVREILAG